MSTSSRSDAARRRAAGAAGLAPPARGARGCRGRSSGAITSGGREQERVRAGAVAVGDDRRRRARSSRRPAARRARRVERRAVAGDEQHARAPRSSAQPTPSARRRRVAARRRSSGSSRRRRRGRAPRRALAGDDEDLVDALGAAQRGRTSVTIASASARRVPALSASSRRCLASSKRLTGRTATGPHREQTLGEAQDVLARRAARAAASSMQRVGLAATGRPSTGSSATRPSSSPA